MSREATVARAAAVLPEGAHLQAQCPQRSFPLRDDLGAEGVFDVEKR